MQAKHPEKKRTKKETEKKEMIGSTVRLNSGRVAVVDKLYAEREGYNVYLDVDGRSMYDIKDPAIPKSLPNDIVKVYDEEADQE